jgi:hypothetical protein
VAKLLVILTGDDQRKLSELLRRGAICVMRGRPQPEGKPVAVKAIVEETMVDELRAQGFTVEVRENLDEAGAKRRALVGKGNRFAGRVRRGR